MSYVSACLIVVLCAAGAAALSYGMRRRPKLETRRRHHEVGNTVFLQLGLLFGVLLAFVYSDVQSGYEATAAAINGEAAALRGAAVLAHSLPDSKGRALDQAILAYTRSVVAVEWPMMTARRARSPATDDALRAVFDKASRLQVAQPAEVNNHAQILSLLTAAHTQRENRLYEMRLGVPAAMWLVLIANTLILMLFVVMAGVESPIVQIMFNGLFAGCTVSILVLVRMLDYPFEGALALADFDFVSLANDIANLPP